MDLPPKAPTDTSILEELKHALVAAERCIELARKQRDSIANASRAHSAGGTDAEKLVLEHAKERREKLEAQDLRAELAPSPSIEGTVPPLGDQPPAAVPILEELIVPG